jgi:hypothetical protein
MKLLPLLLVAVVVAGCISPEGRPPGKAEISSSYIKTGVIWLEPPEVVNVGETNIWRNY